MELPIISYELVSSPAVVVMRITVQTNAVGFEIREHRKPDVLLLYTVACRRLMTTSRSWKIQLNLYKLYLSQLTLCQENEMYR